MEKTLEREIERHARKVLKKYQLKSWVARKHSNNYKKRTGTEPGTKSPSIPSVWELHPHFNPKYCLSHRRYLARTIWKKIQEQKYEPVPAAAFKIPKPTGGDRQIMVFSIPDTAVAKVFGTRLTKRSSKVFSASSFAYRFDKNLFDALLQVQAAIRTDKAFLVQYDFNKYFDSISHAHLRQIVETERTFRTTILERFILRAFIKHRYAEATSYAAGQFKRKSIGIPQGSSVSLWLANVAGHELDQDLDRLNGQFARYADDVICIAHSYEDAIKITSAFRNHCHRTGLEINEKKSPGISLLASEQLEEYRGTIRRGPAEPKLSEEMRSIGHFDYLGHKFTRGGGVNLTDTAVRRIKNRISRIINVHLLFYPRDRRKFNPSRLGSQYYDWDLVTCLNEIRRYIYGGLKEKDFEALIWQNIRLPKVKGLMSFYVLITNPQELRKLDGWLLRTLQGALKERCKVLQSIHNIEQKSLSVESLKSGDWYSFDAIKSETRLPSFLRAWRGARKYFLRFGLGDVVPPKYYGYQ